MLKKPAIGGKRFIKTANVIKPVLKRDAGFTIVEVVVAAGLMIILCVGTLSVYSYVVKLNQSNNLRSQALTVLQAEAEFYRSLKFVPGVGLTDTALLAGDKPMKTAESKDGTDFYIMATVTNISFKDPAAPSEANCTLKEIKLTAVPVNPKPGWLANLKTNLTVQRVRSN